MERTIHLTGGENVTFVSVRSDSRLEAIRDALAELSEMPAPDWEEARVIHSEGGVYVVRVSRDAPDGY